MILLDTQTLVWYLTADKRLGPKSTKKLIGSENLCFSTLSILEYEIKLFDRSLGGQRKVLNAANEAGMLELKPSGEELQRASDFPALSKHDPFDRALVMQASWHNAQLYTSDEKLLSLNLSWIVDSQL